MSLPSPPMQLKEPHWRLCLAASVLVIGAGAFNLWQNAHVAVLWDLSYLLDSAWRFSLGQVPYRDLPFAHAPLTFLLQAALIHLFGAAYWHVIAYAAFANGLALWLTWRICLHLWLGRPWLATALCATLVPLGIYSIYPHPIYDADCLLSVLFAVWLLIRAEMSIPRNLLAGAACVLPLFFKQNIGLLFLAAVLGCVLALLIAAQMRRAPLASQMACLVGAIGALLLALGGVHFTVGIARYRYWTLTFAAQRRLPGFDPVLGIYHQPSLLWSVPLSVAAVAAITLWGARRWIRGLCALLLAAPFLYAAALFFFADDPSDKTDALLSLWPHLLLLAGLFALWQLRRRPTFETLLPLVLLATIHGTFLSQQLWGSTYALWPLLVLLLILMLKELPVPAAVFLTGTITLFLLICGSPYALGHDRLDYIHLEGPLHHATLPTLRGMATPGPWIPDFEQLVQSTDILIPRHDGVLLLPGQDPFYFATGRTPQFPVLLLDPATNPYSPDQLRDEARRRGIRWLVLPIHLQLTADPEPDLPLYVDALMPDFALVTTLDNYRIYRRKSLAGGH